MYHLADALQHPQLRELWNRKEAWAGCSELGEESLKTSKTDGAKLSNVSQ